MSRRELVGGITNHLLWSALWSAIGSAWPSTAQADAQACIAAAEEGQRLRDAGSYRRARQRFIACAAEECPGEIRKRCVAWLGEVETLMPSIVFTAHAQGKEVSDVRVSVDGEVVTEHIDGRPVFLDPGEHRFRFERPGETAIDTTAVVLAGEKQRLIDIRFGPEPVQTSESGAPAATTTATPAPAPTLPTRSPSASSRNLGYALGAAGLVGVLAGVVFDAWGYVILQQCNADPTCTRAHERAEVEWRFVTGDVLLGAGVLCGVAAWLVWPRDTATRAGPQAPATGSGPRLRLGFVPEPGGAGFDLNAAF